MQNPQYKHHLAEEFIIGALYEICFCKIICFYSLCQQASEMRVNFVVMRSAEAQEEGGSSRTSRRTPEPQYFRRRSTYMKVTHKPFPPKSILKLEVIGPCLFFLVIYFISMFPGGFQLLSFNTAALVAVSCKLCMFMFTQRNCDVHSCVAHTQLYHTL